MTTVQGVVDRVGPTLLHAVVVPDEAVAVTDVVIAEPGRHAAAGDLLLGVAANTAKEAAALVQMAGEHKAAGVVLKPPIASSVQRAARSAGVALIEVHGQTAWAQLVWLLRTVLDAAESENDEGDDPASGALGDLFRLADAVAAMVDAPVTIEDANSRVLAYSARQDITDPARVSTIMGRRQPDEVLAKFRSKGVFRQLSKGRSAIFVPAQADGTLPRLIVPIRMGGELLGSMWAVVRDRVSDERSAAFADAGPVVALHLLRRRARTDAQRRRFAETLRGLLDGTGSPRLAVAELGLPDAPHRVVAIDAAGRAPSGEVDAEGVRLALFDRITTGFSRLRAVAELDGVLYAVVGKDSWPKFAETLTAHDMPPLVAAGSATEIGALASSRAEADETLLLLRAGLLEGHSAAYEQAWTVLALHRAAAAAGSAGVAELGPIPVLRKADEDGTSCYVDTLYAWLRHPGDPRAAAEELRIHPNTLRYRIRKIVELTGVSLEDPDIRMALLVQLVTLRWV
ncbi:PucR family transcriptional regulator [Sciscionella sediminilitoris]|uniref:PucR family transcriptional regulator n=1 Tax=Sciscionella sediminilitoris TaxID=1445613 RepID=UPI0004DF36ED|nr:PucR family transcriptional regulator [Sciscionella sp. SE31]